LSLTELVLATLAVTVGATVQGTVGFGLGILGAPLLILIDPSLVPAPLLVAAALLTTLLTHRDRRSVDFSHLKWSLSGRAVGTAVAAAVLAVTSTEQMAVGLGILVLLGVAMSASGLRPQLNPRSLAIAGCLSGFMGTSVSVGAPPIALVYQNLSGPRVRGTLSAYFTVGVVMSLVGLAFVGRFGLREIVLAMSLVPGILLGFLVSRHTAGILDRGYTRSAVLVMSSIAGVAVIMKHVF